MNQQLNKSLVYRITDAHGDQVFSLTWSDLVGCWVSRRDELCDMPQSQRFAELAVAIAREGRVWKLREEQITLRRRLTEDELEAGVGLRDKTPEWYK